LDKLGGIVWGPVTIILLVGTGIFITLLLRGIQVRKLGDSFKLVTGKIKDTDEKGEITYFQALSAALSATIGTGNIAGVGTAIAFGGPGAVF
jgi:AGCS family alanine or glycine:cation symporter